MTAQFNFRQIFRALFILSIIPFACHNSSNESKPDNQADTTSSKNEETLYLFVGTYTLTGSGTDRATGIYIYEMDAKTGALSYVTVSPNTTNPSYLAIHPNKKFLFTVNETGGNGPADFGAVSAFSIDTPGMQLQFINIVSSKGKYPCYISIDPSGKFVMIANYGTGNIALIPVGNTGTLAEASSIIQDQGKGPNLSRQEGPHAHMITPDPEGKFVYATDLGIDKILIYKIDTLEGQLISTNLSAATQPGAGPRHIAFHPAQPWMYVVNELNGTIEAYTRNKESSAITRFQVISTLPSGINKDASCADIHITPNGKYLYASNRGEVNSIAMYAINQNTGELKLLGHQSTHGRAPRNFVIDPAGNFLLVANQDSNNIITFRIDQDNGNLIETGIKTKIPSPVCLKFF